MLAYKQLTKQILRNRIFALTLGVLTALTSLMFFFVRFTIDGNKERLPLIAKAGGDMERYQRAISSNTVLAYVGFACMTLLTAFVFLLFYYRFHRAGGKQMGCLKAIGFRDAYLRRYFIGFTVMLSLTGSVTGLAAAFPLSDVLIRANEKTYGVTGLVRSLNPTSILFEFLISGLCYSAAAWVGYGAIKGKEPGSLIWSGKNKPGYSAAWKAADMVVKLLPVKNKFSLRIALRRPLAVSLMLIAVMTFSVCMILAYSLNISSGKVFASQTEGHEYEYQTSYQELLEADTLPRGADKMLTCPVHIIHGRNEIPQTLWGVYGSNGSYQMFDGKDVMIEAPAYGEAVISEGLWEVYGIRTGDTFVMNISGKEITLTAVNTASNAHASAIYVNGNELAEWMQVPRGSYNMLLSNERPEMAGGRTQSRAERVELLKRDAVSNQISGTINQAIGAVVGCILMFLAVYVNFGDNTKDILILHLMGYQRKEIGRMLIDIYRPMIFAFFLLTLYPGILIVKAIQRSLSVTTGDYMPFGTNIGVIFFTAAILLLIYQMVLLLFNGAVRRVIQREEITEYTSAQ